MKREAVSGEPAPLVEIRRLKKYFAVRSGVFSRTSAWVKAVDDVSLEIHAGEIFALVGESVDEPLVYYRNNTAKTLETARKLIRATRNSCNAKNTAPVLLHTAGVARCCFSSSSAFRVSR